MIVSPRSFLYLAIRITHRIIVRGCQRQLAFLLSQCHSYTTLRFIRPYLDSKTASTIAASIVHSKLDYCNSLSTTIFLNLKLTPSGRFRTVLHVLWLKLLNLLLSHLSSDLCTGSRSTKALNINSFHLPTKLKVLTTSKPGYLHNMISVQSSGRSRSSSVITVARLSVSSSLQITNRSFRYASPYLWNQLPFSFRQPHCVHSPPVSTFTSSCAYHRTTVITFVLMHHLSLPRPFTPDLKLISFTNPYLHTVA